MKHNTQFSIKLKPHGAVAPKINYAINGEYASNGLEFSETMTLEFNLDLEPGTQVFSIEFYNKTNETPDMAVEIESVTIEGMTLDRFKWAGKYYPNYPEPWASMQTKVLPAVHDSATFLGWNGRWDLEFETPIFTWIHKLENLGWIYT
jgi:hypothetical protein